MHWHESNHYSACKNTVTVQINSYPPQIVIHRYKKETCISPCLGIYKYDIFAVKILGILKFSAVIIITGFKM